jgi:ribosomal protein S27AE
MWFGIIVQAFMLGCLAVLVWYAREALRVFNRIDVSFDKLRAFLDVQDINDRRDEAEASAAETAFRVLINKWLPGTQILLTRLLSSTERVRAIAEDIAAPARTTIAMPSPTSTAKAPVDVAVAAAVPPDLAEIERQMDAVSDDGNRPSDDGGETQVLNKPASLILSSEASFIPETTPKPGVSPASRHRVSPTAEPEVMSRVSGYHASYSQPAAPSQIAAGLGPRPRQVSASAKTPASGPHLPPVKPRTREGLAEATRTITLMGVAQPVGTAPLAGDSTLRDDDPDKRMSWEALKREGLIGSSTHPPLAVEPRFPGTMLSMRAVSPASAASPPSPRAAARVEVKEACSRCDGGFISAGHGGIRRCGICSGSGFVETAART